MHLCEQAGITERSEFVRYFMQCGLERRGTQATSYPKRFTQLNLKGFTRVSKKIHLAHAMAINRVQHS